MTTVTGYQGAELGGGGIAGVFHFSSGMVSALRACMGHGSERKLHCRPRKRGLLEVYIYIYIYIYIYMYIYRYRWEVCISIFPQYSARYIEVERDIY